MRGEQRIIGLDLGPASIGWAYLKLSTVTGKSCGKILATNSRIFSAAVEGRGKDQKPKNKGRRDARHMRRQHRRKRNRLRKLRNCLISNGLLANLSVDDLARQFVDMRKFDPYKFRARALEEKLELHHFGRAIFHLAKRRGFRSSRLHGKPKEDGPVLKEIAAVKDEMKKAGFATPGAFLNSQERKRGSALSGRQGYMAREDHESEFEAIWSKQSTYYPEVLSDRFKQDIWDVIFTQGETRWDRSLIGKCSYDPKKKRCYMAHQAAQRFRYWQDINNIKIRDEIDKIKRKLTPEEKGKLAEILESAEKVTVGDIPKRLEINGTIDNLSRSKKTLYGNRTAASFRGALGKTAWNNLTENKKDELINAFYRLGDNDETLKKHLEQKWNFTNEQIQKLLRIPLEQDFSNHSLNAINKMLPFLQAGYLYNEAFRLAKYKDAFRADWDQVLAHDHEKIFRNLIEFKGTQTDTTHLKITFGFSDELIEKTEITYERIKSKFDPLNRNKLEPLNENLRNPIVQKALTQVRQVVNMLIDIYGKPDAIHVELGRELKMTREQKEEYEKQQGRNKRLNDEAELELGRLNHGQRVTNKQKQKYRLWKELKDQRCPYTGEYIDLKSLLQDGLVEIDHIIPYERCWDDSYMNKTICFSHANREKSNRTPREYFADEQKYHEVLERVKDLPEPKLNRFKMTTAEVAEIDWASRQLSDTRFISKKVREYLIQLFDRPEAVSVVTGQSTELLRRNWGLNKILQADGTNEKNRRDHRHHAIDAIVVALTNKRLFTYMSTLAGRNRAEMHSAFHNFEPPWSGFRDEVENAMRYLENCDGQSLADARVISHAPTRRVRGEYFKQGAYMKLPTGEFVHRVPLNSQNITAKNFEKKVVDNGIRQIIRARLEECDYDEKKAFSTPLLHKDGKTPIKRVRVIEDKFVERKAHIEYDVNGKPIRYYASGGNHHAELFENIKTKKRRIKVITSHEAFENIRKCIQSGEVPCPNSWEIKTDERPLFTLCANDYVEYRGKDGQLRVYRVQKMSEGKGFELALREPNDGFTQPKEGRPNRIQSVGDLSNITRKLQVDPLGRLTQASD